MFIESLIESSPRKPRMPSSVTLVEPVMLNSCRRSQCLPSTRMTSLSAPRRNVNTVRRAECLRGG